MKESQVKTTEENDVSEQKILSHEGKEDNPPHCSKTPCLEAGKLIPDCAMCLKIKCNHIRGKITVADISTRWKKQKGSLHYFYHFFKNLGLYFQTFQISSQM